MFFVIELTRFGGDLLSHDLSRSTIGAVALNGRVRKGTGCFAHAMTTKPRKLNVSRILRLLSVVQAKYFSLGVCAFGRWSRSGLRFIAVPLC